MTRLVLPTLLRNPAGGFVGAIQSEAFQLYGGGGATYSMTPTASALVSGRLCWQVSNNYLDSVTNGRIADVKFASGASGSKLIEVNDGVFSGSIWAGYAGAGSPTGDIVDTLEAASLQYWNTGFQERDDGVASSPSDGTNSASGHSTTPSVSITTTNARDVLVACLLSENGFQDALTNAAGWNPLYLDSDGLNQVPCAAAWLDVSSAGTYTATFGIAVARDWKCIIAAIKRQ